MSKFKMLIDDPKIVIYKLNNLGLFKPLNDKKFLEFFYKLRMGKKIDFSNVQGFNQKLQWLKLYDRKSEHTTLVDKYAVKKYLKNIIGEEYIIPTLGVWNDFNEIDFNKLPNQFVLKCTHDSGGLVICKDKSNLDFINVKKLINKSMKRNYYKVFREWPYKNVKHQIIAEQFMQDKSGGLIDYKFFCFNGYVDCVMLCIDRHLNDTKFYFFDEEWNLLRLNKRGLEAPENFSLPKPKCINKMFELAKKLSVGMKFVRVDLYECNDKVYFGEMTFFPDSGFDLNISREADERWGNLIKIDN